MKEINYLKSKDLDDLQKVSQQLKEDLEAA